MLDNLRYFFRAIPDEPAPHLSQGVHLAIVIVWLAVIFLIMERATSLKNSSYRQLPLKIIAGILLLDQVILNSWFIGQGLFNLDIHLPLYHCRIATWIIIVAVFFKKPRLSLLALWWGLMGSIVTMISSDIYPYNFPHYTNFNFVFMHLCLGWFAVYNVAVNGYSFPVKDLRRMIVVMNAYNLGLLGFNLFLRGQGLVATNYGYLLSPPPALEFVYDAIGRMGYVLFVFAAYSLMLVIVWLIGSFVLVPLSNYRQSAHIKQSLVI